MKKTTQILCNCVFGVLFACFCVWVIVRTPTSLSHLRVLVQTKHPAYMIGHFAILCFVFLLFLVAWRYSVQALGESCAWRTAASSWLVPNLGKYLPGKVLMLAGRVEFLHRRGFRRSIGSAALVFEHVTMLIAAMPFLLLALLWRSASVQVSYLIAGVAFAVPMFAVALCPQLLITAINALLQRFSRAPLLHVPKRRAMFVLIGIYTCLWFAYGISGHLLLTVLFPQLSIPIIPVIAAFPAAWLVGFLAFIAPAGLGVRETTLVLTFGQFMGAGDALSLAIAARLTWTITEMLGVVVGWSLIRKRMKSLVKP